MSNEKLGDTVPGGLNNASEMAMSDDGDDFKQGEVKPSIRSTSLRWLMLGFGSFFLMGSYFCYDNPAALASYLEDTS